MPYSPEHKEKTRHKIVECARILFNRKGFHDVTIDEVMQAAGLTRGGFYNHFKTKEELYAEAVAAFLNGRGKDWRDAAGVDPLSGDPQTVVDMVKSYLSAEHLGDIDGQCPMIALPSDAARAPEQVQEAYEGLLRAMVWLFENNSDAADKRRQALLLSTLCVGGMVLARTVQDEGFAREIRETALEAALGSVKADQSAA